MSAHNAQSLITIDTLNNLKANGEKFTCLTAYELTLANVISSAGVEVILVGDSLGMVIQGHNSTLPVTMNDLIYHLKNVSRGNINSHDFFVDCEGHIKDQKLRIAIKEVIDTGAIVRNFGSYPEYI